MRNQWLSTLSGGDAEVRAGRDAGARGPSGFSVPALGGPGFVLVDAATFTSPSCVELGVARHKVNSSGSSVLKPRSFSSSTMRWLLSFLVLALLGVAQAVSYTGRRLLVVLEDVAEKEKYSVFLGDLEGECDGFGLGSARCYWSLVASNCFNSEHIHCDLGALKHHLQLYKRNSRAPAYSFKLHLRHANPSQAAATTSSPKRPSPTPSPSSTTANAPTTTSSSSPQKPKASAPP